MEKVRDTLAIIFFLIWIPLGLLLAGGIITMIIMNPLGMMQDAFSSSMGEMERFGPEDIDPYDPGGRMPSREIMDQVGPADEFEEYIPSSR